MSKSEGSCKRAALSAALARRRREGRLGTNRCVGNAASVDAERRVACEPLDLVI